MCRDETGFSIVSALFLLIVLAGLAAWLTSIVTMQAGSATLDLTGSRAYLAARAGAEWAAYKIMDPRNTSAGATAFPNCPSSAGLALEDTLAPYTVSVTCARYDYVEGSSRRIAVYQVTAKASAGTVATPTYVERQISAQFSRCKDSAGQAPRYGCE